MPRTGFCGAEAPRHSARHETPILADRGAQELAHAEEQPTLVRPTILTSPPGGAYDLESLGVGPPPGIQLDIGRSILHEHHGQRRARLDLSLQDGGDIRH